MATPEEEVEEKGEGEKPELPEVSVGGDLRFSQEWEVVSGFDVPPEVMDWLEEFKDLDVDLYMVLSYLLVQHIDEDPLDVAKDVLAWRVDLQTKWQEKRRKKAKGGA